MAKERNTTAEPVRATTRDSVEALAAELFAKYWQPKSATTNDWLAATCFAAATEFEQIAERIREGESPAEIICPPELAAA